MNKPKISPDNLLLFPGRGPRVASFKLIEVYRGVLEFHPTRSIRVLRGLLSGLGILAIAVGGLVFLFTSDIRALVGIPAGLLFFYIGARVSSELNQVRRFDSQRRMVTIPSSRGRARPRSMTFSFGEVKRIEIASKLLPGGEDDDYFCYELIVIQRSGMRLLVIEHPDCAIATDIGQRLAQLIGCEFKTLFET